jgi:hypothetical protein
MEMGVHARTVVVMIIYASIAEIHRQLSKFYTIFDNALSGGYATFQCTLLYNPSQGRSHTYTSGFAL